MLSKSALPQTPKSPNALLPSRDLSTQAPSHYSLPIAVSPRKQVSRLYGISAARLVIAFSYMPNTSYRHNAPCFFRYRQYLAAKNAMCVCLSKYKLSVRA